MAHMVETMFSVVETPWHRLGTVLEKAPTAEEAIVCAGLDWNVEKRQLALPDGRKVDTYATVRTADERILGTKLGPGYEVLQNKQAFDWFNPFLASGEATLETAGSLRNGEVVWILARIGSEDSVIVKRSDDRIRKYLLLSNTHDGSKTARVGFSPTRVVCANTLAMAHSDKASALLRVKHTKSMHDTLAVVRDTINMANQEFEATAEQYRKLAAKQVAGIEVIKQVVAKVFDAPEIETLIPGRFLKEGRAEKNARVRQETIERLYETGRGNDLPGTRGTLWALYNGITEYLQYEAPRSTEESRIDALAFDGLAGKRSDKALKVLLEMAA